MATLTRLNSDVGDILLTNLKTAPQDCNIKMPVVSGKSAYDLAVENGYVGSLQDWLSSLNGWKPIDSEFSNYLEQHLQLSSLFNDVNSKIEANKAELDARIEERISEASAITTQLQNEAEARVADSKQLSQSLLDEAKNRINAIGQLANDIQSESLIRTSEIEQLHADIEFEQVNRVAEIDSLKNITIDQNMSIASITTQLTTVGEALETKASATALEDIVSKVTTVNGEVEAHSAKLVQLTDEIEGKANSSALQALTNTVSEFNGAISSNSNAITQLNNSVTEIDNKLVNKADASALSDYYTKVQANDVISGKVEEFTANYSKNMLPSETDFKRANTWSRVVYSKTGVYINNVDIPDYPHLINCKKHSENYFLEGHTMTDPIDNSFMCYRAVFTVDTARVIDLGNLTGDDAHAVYIDNIKVHTAGEYSTNPCSFQVTVGEHIIDIIVNNSFGGAGFSSTIPLSSQVNSMYAVKLVYQNIELNASAISNTYTKAEADSVTTSKIEEFKTSYVDNELGKKFNASAINNYYTIANANEAINNKIDSYNASLVIGGRNLALNTGIVRNDYYWIVETSSPLIEGKEYTLSFDYIGNVNGELFLNNAIRKNYPAIHTSTWLRVSVTFVFIKNDYQGHELVPHVYGATKLRNLKLELGNKATDWTPAPEDVDQKISDINANITNNYYTAAKVNEAIASQTSDIKTTVGNHTSSIQQHSESINGIKANWTLKLNANGRISGMTLMNDDSTSEFAIEADNFYVGAIDSAYKPFQVKTVGWTGVDGRSYPSGVYINNAVIGDLDAKVIRAGTITADKLAIGTPNNLVSNFSRVNSGIGWYNYTGIGIHPSFDGTNTPCMEIRTQHSIEVQTERFKIDPAKSYEFTVWLYSEGGNTAGTDYIGVNTFDSGGNRVVVTAFDVNNPNSNWDEGNPYFWIREHDKNHRYKWVKYTGYVLAAGTDLSSIKGALGQNVDRCFRFKSNTDSMLFRILNFYNDGTTVNNLYMAHPTVREVDTNSLIETVNNKKATNNLYYPGTTQIDGAKIQTGSITANQIAVGSITSEKLVAGSITTEKLAVGSSTNLWANPQFKDYGPGIKTMQNNGGLNNVGGRNGWWFNRDAYGTDDTLFPVCGGEEFLFEYLIGYHSGNCSVGFHLYNHSKEWQVNINALPINYIGLGSGWFRASTSVKIPNNIDSAYLARVSFWAHENSAITISDLVVTRKNSGQLIVDGTITADKIDTRGLSIKDDNGKVILGAGTTLNTQYINGLASFAFVNYLSAYNIGSYIEGAAIKNLLVDNARIGNANIDNASIGTLQLRDQAVSVVTTIKVDLSYSTRVPFSGSTQAVYLDAGGGMVKVDAFFIGAKCNGHVVISIVRDGNILPGYNIYSTGDTITLPFLTSGGYGNSAFSIYVSGSFEATGYVITATALKR